MIYTDLDPPSTLAGIERNKIYLENETLKKFLDKMFF